MSFVFRVFLCSPLPPPRSRASHTVLTQADWCSTRAVARCELGLLRVIRGDRFSSVLALTRNQDTVLRNRYARMIKVSRHNTFSSPQQPSPSSTEPERSELADHCHAMEKEEAKILTHRAVMAVPTFLIKLLFPRVQESLAANRECSSI